MTTSDYEPDIIIYPFHGTMPGMPDLYHVRCSRHPEFAGCFELAQAGDEVQHHMREHGREANHGTGD